MSASHWAKHCSYRAPPPPLVPSAALNASTTVRHSMILAPARRCEAWMLQEAGTTKRLKPSCGAEGRHS